MQEPAKSPQPPKEPIGKKLRVKYRLLIMDEDTFEQKLSLLLSPMNIITFLGSLSIFLIILVTYIIAFTGLREYIPGYSDLDLRRQAYENDRRLDSLEQQIALRDHYVANLFTALGDSVAPEVMQKPDSTRKSADLDQSISDQDSMLRAMVDEEERFNLRVMSFSRPEQGDEGIRHFYFFPPLKGQITEGFSADSSHFGIDIVSTENEPVRAALDGTVILSTWTYEAGNVLAIQHTSDLVTFYKHNSALLKKQGERVKAGDVVAIIGNTGQHTSGPHLHFELWFRGRPVNPVDYLVF